MMMVLQNSCSEKFTSTGSYRHHIHLNFINWSLNFLLVNKRCSIHCITCLFILMNWLHSNSIYSGILIMLFEWGSWRLNCALPHHLVLLIYNGWFIFFNCIKFCNEGRTSLMMRFMIHFIICVRWNSYICIWRLLCLNHIWFMFSSAVVDLLERLKNALCFSILIVKF